MKRFVIVLVAPLFTSATWAGPVREKNEAIARRVFGKIFKQNNFEPASEIYAPDLVNHGLQRSFDLKADQEAANGWKLAFPDLKITVVKEIAADDLVALLWTATGTNTGEGDGLPATRKKTEIRGTPI